MFLALLLLPLVYSGDVIHFDWDSIPHPFSEDSIIHHDRMDSNPKNNDLESEYGVFERPKFQTQRNRTLRDKIAQKLTHMQKIPKFPEDNTRNRINLMLRNYLTKLYLQKYNNRGVKMDQESKLFDSTFSGLKNKTKNFTNKFLSLFTIVQFPNAQCQSSSTAGDYWGTCYHQTECANMNGTALGDCADGYGVCCVFRYSCGSSSSQNCTYFESPGYPDYDPPGSMVLPPNSSTMPPVTTAAPPTPDPRWKYYYRARRWRRQTDSTLSCTISVYKQSENIQQMRIDFIDLELKGPTNGTCVNERLVITGQNVNDQVPVICGYNTGQHVFVDVSTLSGPLRLSVLSNNGERKRYKIRICQIAAGCSNSNNCLQYYTGVTGMISSFNYDQAAMINRSEPGYFNNLNYAICIRKEAGYCSITYTNTPGGLEYPFQLPNLDDVSAAGQNTVPPGQAGVEIFNCPDDYVVIGGLR
ncbi:hypothetical protein BDFB_008651, partial [Asbolus verrucosus]